MSYNNMLAYKEYMNNDKSELITEKNGVHFLLDQPLLSVSSFYNWYSKLKFANIPEYVLENARNEGCLFMETLQDLFAKKPDDLSEYAFPSKKIEFMIKSFLYELEQRNWKILQVEKHITNGYWHGYVDCIAKCKTNNQLALIEIKTRGDTKAKIMDGVQVSTYAKIMGMEHHDIFVAVINRNNFDCEIHRVSGHQFQRYFTTLDKFFTVIGETKYCFKKRNDIEPIQIDAKENYDNLKKKS